MSQTQQPATKQVKVISTKGMFTTVAGVDVPVHSVLHRADTIQEAADWLAQYTGRDPQTVENGGFIFEEED